MSGGADGGGNDDEMRASLPWRKPWWRSVGFWLGVPGLFFLLWMWRDSFSHGSHAGVMRSATYSSGTVPFPPWLVVVRDGAVVYQRARVTGESLKVTISPQWPVASWRKGMSSGKALTGMWGSSSDKIVVWSPFAFEAVRWWCSFGFVVAGYVVVWIGSMVMWRRWSKRRWEAERVVG